MADQFNERTTLELLEDYRKDDTKRHRRNLILTAFIVILVDILHLPLKDFRLGVVTIPEGKEIALVWIAGVMLLFWQMSYILCLARDGQIHAERLHQFVRETINVRAELEKIKLRNDEWKARGAAVTTAVQRDHDSMAMLSHYLDQHDNQRKRTRYARHLDLITDFVERYLPLAMTWYALYGLFGIYNQVLMP